MTVLKEPAWHCRPADRPSEALQETGFTRAWLARCKRLESRVHERPRDRPQPGRIRCHLRKDSSVQKSKRVFCFSSLTLHDQSLINHPLLHKVSTVNNTHSQPCLFDSITQRKASLQCYKIGFQGHQEGDGQLVKSTDLWTAPWGAGSRLWKPVLGALQWNVL